MESTEAVATSNVGSGAVVHMASTAVTEPSCPDNTISLFVWKMLSRCVGIVYIAIKLSIMLQ